MRVIKKSRHLNKALAGFGLVLGLGTAMAADPVTVNVNFTGEVTASNCVFAGGPSLDVNLQPISVDALKKYPAMPTFPVQVGGSAATTIPDITLTGCSDNISVVFTTATPGGSSLANLGGTAKGVNLMLINNNPDYWLGANNGMRLTATKTGAGTYIIRGLKADYIRDPAVAEPTAGTVKASGTITVTSM